MASIKCNRIMSFSALPFSATYNCSNISLPRKLSRNVHVHGNSLSSSISQSSSVHAYGNIYSKGQRGLSLIAFDAKNSEPMEEDNNQALDAVMKLYSAFKNKNTQELSDILADECRCVCNFQSFFKAFQGKTQVLEFFSYLIRLFGDNIQIVMKPTLHDGMNVGVHWKFEWKDVHIPLGKGFSVYICQTYRGKAVIRNIEMFIEPLLYFEPHRVKIKATLTEIVKKIGLFTASELESENKAKKILCIVLAVLLMVAMLLFFMKIAS